MFSFKRFSEQFRINILQNAFRHGMFLLIICLFLIINHFEYFHLGGFAGKDMLGSALYVVSIMSIITSIDMFRKLSRTDSGIHYLMAPASTLEKYLAAWIYSTLFTFIVYIALYCIVHTLSMLIGNLLTGLNLPYQHFELSQLWEYFIKMMFIQSIYFLGAILFKKNSFVKTTATLFGCGILISIIGSYMVKHFFEASCFNLSDSVSVNIDGSLDNEFVNGSSIPETFKYYGHIIKTIIYVIPFICWSTAYIKLKNTEI